MAFPVVQATNESKTVTAGTSHTVNLPAFTGGSSVNDIGKILLVCLNIGSTAATVDALAGWTELADEGVANGMYVAWRKVNGTEGTTITLTTSASTRSAEITYLISEAADPSVTPPTISTVLTGSSATPESSSVAVPSSTQSDFLVISAVGMAGEEADDDTWANTAPSGYTNLLQISCGTTGVNLGGLIASSQRTINTTAEDPGTFGVDVSATWRGFTIAVAALAVATPRPSDAAFMRILGVGGLRKGVKYSPQADAPVPPTPFLPKILRYVS